MLEGIERNVSLFKATIVVLQSSKYFISENSPNLRSKSTHLQPSRQQVTCAQHSCEVVQALPSSEASSRKGFRKVEVTASVVAGVGITTGHGNTCKGHNALSFSTLLCGTVQLQIDISTGFIFILLYVIIQTSSNQTT